MKAVDFHQHVSMLVPQLTQLFHTTQDVSGRSSCKEGEAACGFSLSAQFLYELKKNCSLKNKISSFFFFKVHAMHLFLLHSFPYS